MDAFQSTNHYLNPIDITGLAITPWFLLLWHLQEFHLFHFLLDHLCEVSHGTPRYQEAQASDIEVIQSPTWHRGLIHKVAMSLLSPEVYIYQWI